MTAIRIQPGDIDRARSDLRHFSQGVPIAVMRAVNRGVTGIRTDLVASARQKYNVQAKAVRKNITVKKASQQDMTAYVESKGKPIPLLAFAPRPAQPAPKRRVPITVEVIRGERKSVEKAFVAVMPKAKAGQATQHKGVFKRVERNGKMVNRLPIRELWGPRIEDHYAKPEVMVEIQKNADARTSKELNHQVDRLFAQRVAK